MLRASGADAAEAPALLSSSGVAEIDALCRAEVDRLNRAFEVSASFAFYDDAGSPNAQALDRPTDRLAKDGTVLFGRALAVELAAGRTAANALPILAVMAHEWGHIRQYKSRVVSDWGVHFELSADFLAGWYLSYRRDVGNAEMAKVISQFTGLGDNSFTREEHHGTPAQRSRMLAFAFTGLQSPDLTADTQPSEPRDPPKPGDAVQALETSLHLLQ